MLSICQQPPLHLNLRVRLLHGRAGTRQPAGKLLVIRDVTDFYQTQIELERTNEAQRQTQLELQATNQLLTRRLLENEVLKNRLQEQAIRDGLTGLFNRRYFEEALAAEFAKARRANSLLSVILLDIDRFKQVNDTYGHQAGDCALEAFARIVRAHVRSSDIACRYGGEEFIIAMPGISLADARQRAEDLRIAFGSAAIQYGEHTIRATLSGGVGAFPDYDGSQDGLISLVDKALYAAKRDGRDRIYPIQLKNAPVQIGQPTC